jgi:hypothetical protein
VHLQEVVTGTGDRQLQKVEADAPAPPRQEEEQEEDTSGCLMLRLAKITRSHGTCLQELIDRRPNPATTHLRARASML